MTGPVAENILPDVAGMLSPCTSKDNMMAVYPAGSLRLPRIGLIGWSVIGQHVFWTCRFFHGDEIWKAYFRFWDSYDFYKREKK